MAYAYAQPARSTPEGRIAIFQHPLRPSFQPTTTPPMPILPSASTGVGPQADDDDKKDASTCSPPDLSTSAPTVEVDANAEARRVRQETKLKTMSTMSIYLTLLSICVAFSYVACLDFAMSYQATLPTPLALSFTELNGPNSISLITIMGLIGENCSQCTAAAEAEDGGGLAGSWWRGWARVSPAFSALCFPSLFQLQPAYKTLTILPRRHLQANDQSGYIGAAIVGVFACVLAGSWAVRGWMKRRRGKQGGARVR